MVGALLLNMRSGAFVQVQARPRWWLPGGGPTQYRFHAPGPEKSVDGLGMLYRAGVRMRDMEMLQFHPTGLIIPGSVVAGALLEEGLRGVGPTCSTAMASGSWRNMTRTLERTTRDVISRSSYLEMQAGRACPEGGVYIVAAHLGPEFVRRTSLAW